MTILEIRKHPDEALLTPVQELAQADIKGHKIQTLIEDMIDTCIDAGGAGLAANQVGENVSLFVLRWAHKKSQTRTEFVFEAFINPEIIWKKEKQHCKGEGCLSVPGKYFNVKRYKQLKLKYLDRNGKEAVLTVKRKKLAQAVLHEMDHLAGITLAQKGKEA